jgi:putative ABC transport system permease protein
MRTLDDYVMTFLDNPLNVITAGAVAFLLVAFVVYYRFIRLIFKSLARNLLRTALTGLAIFVLVLVITLIWSGLAMVDEATAEKSKDFKVIASERWQLPSQMPFSYEKGLEDVATEVRGERRPQDLMSWQFYGATLDPKRTRESLVFFFCMEPGKLLTMMDDLDTLTGQERSDLEALVKAMEEDKRRVVIGRERLKSLNKRVGERISLYSINYQGIDLDDCEIIGTLPDGRWNQIAVMHRDRLNNALDSYEVKNHKPHPLAKKALNIVWMRVPDTETFNRLSRQVTESPSFTDPAVKCETASSGIASFLDAYRDMIWGIRWLLVPAILITLALVIATAISISVRERRKEIAVLKVLGFGPGQVLILVLGEALLIGCFCGLLSAGLTDLFINGVLGGVKFPIGFFPAFRIPHAALWWGPLVGGLTALVGSLVPAWGARSVKVAEVFSKIA